MVVKTPGVNLPVVCLTVACLPEALLVHDGRAVPVAAGANAGAGRVPGSAAVVADPRLRVVVVVVVSVGDMSDRDVLLVVVVLALRVAEAHLVVLVDVGHAGCGGIGHWEVVEWGFI
ncbi:hypothetical protein F4810DRAFT_692823 [Camillea tinctor]|nr:hypothetical protein F4810DRAFT_692823 [Camillea tinctor]